jgi:hypothetical protein
MRDLGPRTPRKMRGPWPFLGLLMVLAFLGHDVIMAAPAPALAAGRASSAVTLDSAASQASSPHPHGCTIGQPAALGIQTAPLAQSTSSGVIDHPALTRLTGLPTYAATTQARSPTAQRAILQVFRI